MGAHCDWETAAAHPSLFAAIASISGGGNSTNAATIANMPTWAFHGAQDEVVPLEASESMIKPYVRLVDSHE